MKKSHYAPADHPVAHPRGSAGCALFTIAQSAEISWPDEAGEAAQRALILLEFAGNLACKPTKFPRERLRFDESHIGQHDNVKSSGHGGERVKNRAAGLKRGRRLNRWRDEGSGRKGRG